jgi:hypothetical protein
MVSIVTSSANHSRMHHALSWLEIRSPAEEILILGATADAANELARDVAQRKGAAFGWHRLSFAQFAAVLAAPLLAMRGLVALGDLGVRALLVGDKTLAEDIAVNNDQMLVSPEPIFVFFVGGFSSRT